MRTPPIKNRWPSLRHNNSAASYHPHKAPSFFLPSQGAAPPPNDAGSMSHWQVQQARIGQLRCSSSARTSASVGRWK